jgi:hypothetical protein
MNRKEFPLYIITFYSGYVFFTKGINRGIENWRFYASLFGFLGFITLLFLLKKRNKRDKDKN